MMNLKNDPRLLHDLAGKADSASTKQELEAILIRELEKKPLEWIDNGPLKGAPHAPPTTHTHRGLSGQRGLHWHPPQIKDVSWG